MNPRGKSPLSFNRGVRRGISTMHCIVFNFEPIPNINVPMDTDIFRSDNTVQSLNRIRSYFSYSKLGNTTVETVSFQSLFVCTA